MRPFIKNGDPITMSKSRLPRVVFEIVKDDCGGCVFCEEREDHGPCDSDEYLWCRRKGRQIPEDLIGFPRWCPFPTILEYEKIKI
jgi:hypothetical protein